MTRAATTLAGPCTGAPRRDFLLGLRHGQLVRAHVPSWCSGHGVDGWLLPTSWPAWPAYNSWLPDACRGYSMDAPRRLQRARVGVLEPTPGGVHEPGQHRRPRSCQAHLSAPWG